MAAWHFYFLAKLVLHALGRLRVNPVLSGLLLALVLAPRWGPLAPEPRGRRARGVLAWSLALSLAWSESWLPPPAAVWRFLSDSAVSPSPAYVLRFLAGAVHGPALLALAALAAAVAGAARRRLRLTPFVLAGLAAVAVSDPSAFRLSSAARALDAFYAEESRREVRFDPASGPGGPAAGPDFDILLLHVCSLSWEDLASAGLAGDPFLRGFTSLWTGFTSATSYSNPASIRLLRAPCGQRRHEGIFSPAPDECYLLDALRGRGYRSWAASNHDGTYDHYAAVLKTHARADEPMGLDGIPVAKLNFNGSAIYDDAAVLERWWRARQESGARRAVLYYNTVSLHQGAHRPEQAGDWFSDRRLHYREAAGEFFAALSRFFALIEGSGRRAVVLLVAEHGAALEGSAVQAPDLRDIPLPQLTSVPVAVRVLGPGAPPPLPAAFDRPVSYLALAELLRRFLNKPPFGGAQALSAEYLAGLPETPFVAENEGFRVMEHAGRYLVQERRGRWKALPAGTAARPSP